MKTLVLEKELSALEKQRAKYLNQYSAKKELAPELAAKIPIKLQSTLNSAFCQAFEVIYKNGTPLIDKTYDKNTQNSNIELIASPMK